MSAPGEVCARPGCGRPRDMHRDWGKESLPGRMDRFVDHDFVVGETFVHASPETRAAVAEMTKKWPVTPVESRSAQGADLVICMDCGQRRMTTDEMKAHHCPPGKCHAIGCNDPRHVADHDWVECDEKHGCGRPDGCHREPRCDVPKDRHPSPPVADSPKPGTPAVSGLLAAVVAFLNEDSLHWDETGDGSAVAIFSADQINELRRARDLAVADSPHPAILMNAEQSARLAPERLIASTPLGQLMERKPEGWKPVADSPKPADEAEAWREIAESNWEKLKQFTTSTVHGVIRQTAREAFAAGREQGERDERKACEAIARMLPQTPRVKVARTIAEAIAARSSKEPGHE